MGGGLYRVGPSTALRAVSSGAAAAPGGVADPVADPLPGAVPGTGRRCGKHEPGRLRVRLPWAHGLAALLLVAVAALSAAPVQAQTTPLWSTTMTVGQNTSGGRGYDTSTGIGSVDNDSFSFAGTTVQVSALVSGGGARLGLSFTGTITVAQLETLILEWAGETFPLADKTTTQDSNKTFLWSAAWAIDNAPSLDLFSYEITLPDGGTVAACLRTAGQVCPGGTPLSSDATLSGLALKDGSTAIDLTPSTFVATTTSYTASVANAVDEITIVPTVNDDTAAYEIQDSGGTVLTDADSNADDFQVDLDVGANTIKVEVTAEDGTTETYQVTVTRAAAATPTVTISRDRTSAVFKEDDIEFTVTRTGSTTAALSVTVALTQTKNFLASSNLSQTVTIGAGQSTGTFTITAANFQHFATGTKVEGGTLTATVQDILGYDPGTPSSVDVAIVIGVVIRFDMAAYSVAEGAGTLTVKLIARTGPGAARPTYDSSFQFSTPQGSALANTDYVDIGGGDNFLATDFTADGGVWKAEKTYDIAITNDTLDETDETFEFQMHRNISFESFSFVDASGNSCGDTCTATVTIVDDDAPIPSM